MKYAEAEIGRVFVVRLEDGEIIHESLESFARERGVRAAAVVAVGAADGGSILVAGPEDGNELPVHPMERVLDGVHEVAGTGTIFSDEEGNPLLHMHIASGRDDTTVTGCVRRGVRVWRMLEVVVFELAGPRSRRVFDPGVGFSVLEP